MLPKSKPPVKRSQKPTGGRKAKEATVQPSGASVAVEALGGSGEATVKAKHPGGRPTKYDPSYCEKVIEWGRQGKSRTWMAAEIGIDRDTIDNWASAHQEFFGALARAKTLEQQWWEDAGQVGMVSDKFNNGVWAKSMACRFSNDWREKQSVEHTGADGGPIEFSITDILTNLDGSSRTLPVEE